MDVVLPESVLLRQEKALRHWRNSEQW
jgi:hypothetical protein